MPKPTTFDLIARLPAFMAKSAKVVEDKPPVVSYCIAKSATFKITAHLAQYQGGL